jgi:hypothetical protein
LQTRNKHNQAKNCCYWSWSLSKGHNSKLSEAKESEEYNKKKERQKS